jgi:hypothetical protein
MGSFGKNAFATTRLPTHKQGMADFQRTFRAFPSFLSML